MEWPRQVKQMSNVLFNELHQKEKNETNIRLNLG